MREYQCHLYTNENQGGIQIKIYLNEPLASLLALPFSIGFLSGELNTGYKFSLVNCLSNHMVENNLSTDMSVYTYSSKYMLKGVGGKDCSCVKFKKAVFELDNAIRWGDISGYTVGDHYELEKSDDQTKTLYENELICVKYIVTSTMLPVHNSELLKEKIILKQNGNIEVAFKEDETIEMFDDVFRKTMRLVELSMLQNIHLVKLTAWSRDSFTLIDERQYDRPIDIISYAINREPEESEGKSESVWMWITLPELLVNNSFIYFFSKFELLEPIIAFYSEILKSAEMSTIRVFLNIVQALETYHSRFITNDIGEFKSRISTIILKGRPEGFVHDDTAFLMAKSKKFITLESRLADLLLARFEIIFDTGDINHRDFPNVIARTRNYYVHYDEGIKALGRVLTEEELSVYNSTLFYILEYYLLLELGFKDTKQIRVKLNERWQNASLALSLIKKSKEVEKSSATKSSPPSTNETD